MMCTKWIFILSVLFSIGDIFVVAYSNQWAMHIVGGPNVAKQVADEYGFRNLGQIFDDWYHFDHPLVVKRSIEPHREIHQKLIDDNRVKRAEQQRIKSRKKRDFITTNQKQTILNDERWSLMWYLNRGKGLDMNVQDAWAEGITGRGIVVTILDDGLEKDHPDLKDNYDPQASYDVNNHDEDPMPRYDFSDSNRHGTRCAGEVAATANNSICAVGIAFRAQVGGVRMLDGDVTDAVEARSLSLNPQHIDIYSASWGPDDDGKTVDGPGELATRAFIEGITKGRDGKGSIFIWASGNGGKDGDNCNCDGYTNSIWTLSISSATENGFVPWYSEKCSSTLATTYSSGSQTEKQIITTDLHHYCTSSHTGTSASAPLAAGICALVLEANRNLTWRDMQHIVVRTAKPANLNATDWVTNGIGRNVSHSFGYGLMDASAMVRLARKWRTVPEQHTCEVIAPQVGQEIPAKKTLSFELNVKECRGVNFLEHVQAKVTLTAVKRGNLEIFLTSPQGTRSTLLAKRPHDMSKAGFNQWPFMSVHTWGEKPHGIWTLEIHNDGRYLDHLEEWKLIFYGTETAVEIDDKPGQIAISEYEVPSESSTDVKQNIIGNVDNSWIGNQKIDRYPQSEHSTQRPTSEKQTSENCKIMNSSHECIVCKENWFLTKGRCVLYCPAGTYGASDERYSVCAACHYSCARCSGPSGNQCTTCRADASLIEFHCVLSSISWKMQATRWFYWMTIFFIINLSTITAAGIYLCVFWFRRKHNPHTYDYSKVSYSQNAKAECGANDSASDSE
ncbi:furin-like protease 1 [Leptopilina boulardi]|uniref:furin-like protease 1 n=1 Tax=Leptopilina boulardi TaxID=63433 RepID=UPI0021F524E7|nr:furin-like protease 1 [Leptopilina boulardi]XP_051170797.1 furin-like protease 1 [Leptopilina boulardi]